MRERLKRAIPGGGGLFVVLDFTLNSAEFLVVLAETVLTPMLLFAFTILPNIDIPAEYSVVTDVFVGAVIVLGTVALVDAATDAIQRWRKKNGD